MKTVDIIIAVYNQLPYTIETINSIIRYTENYNLIIIDNASTDGTKEWLQVHKQDNWLVIRNETNLGYIKAVNQGLLNVSQNDVVLINNDVIVTENWLTKLQLHTQHYSIVAPITNNISGMQKDMKALYNSIETMHLYAKSCENRSVMEFPRVTFFCVYITREVISKVGFLDENFYLGNFDDDDYCLRALNMGFKIAIAENVFIHHFGSVSFKQINYSEIMEMNKKKFIDKWGEPPVNIWGRIINEMSDEQKNFTYDRLSEIRK